MTPRCQFVIPFVAMLIAELPAGVVDQRRAFLLTALYFMVAAIASGCP